MEALICEINRAFLKVETAPAGFVKLAKAAEMNQVPMEFILIGYSTIIWKAYFVSRASRAWVVCLLIHKR
ncbi:hypothetical protein FLP41_12340 [Paracoccus marcusii]|uniref:hypothetical protein n=1 Tax=Paracoccus marcusii TaxID=59779 RepID=UPI002ED5D6BA|nr:hypothetical protein FLP41_12340 [Paracoccus marcusii]